MHTHVYSSTIYNSWILETTQMPINQWIDKEDVAFYAMEYYYAIKANFETFLGKWEGEPGKVRGKGRDKEKNGNKDFAE